MRPKVVVDCDPGVDDALGLAVAWSFCDVLAVTTVGGNVPADLGAQNASALAALLGAPPLELGVGLEAPLPRSHAGIRHHGEDGLGGVSLPPADVAPGLRGPEKLADVLSKNRGAWIIALGPLTNVAYALRKYPTEISSAAGLSWMGGALGAGGNVNPLAEFNAFADPAAAKTVIAEFPGSVLVTGLDVTHRVLVTREWLATIKHSGRAGKFFARALSSYLVRQEGSTTLAGVPVHDALAVLRVTHPQYFTSMSCWMDVVADQGLAWGHTYTDARPRREIREANVSLAVDVDVGAILRLLQEVFWKQE